VGALERNTTKVAAPLGRAAPHAPCAWQAPSLLQDATPTTDRLRFNLALLHFGTLALGAYALHARAEGRRLRLLLKGMALSNLVLALGGAVGRQADILGFPLFAILSMLRAVANPALYPLALPLLSRAAERAGARALFGPRTAAVLALVLSAFGGYTTLSHILFRAEMRPDTSFLSLGLLRYYPHPQAPAFAMLVPPLVLAASALSAGLQLYQRCGTVALLAGAAAMVSSMVGRAEAVVWSAPVGEMLHAAALLLVTELRAVEPVAARDAGECPPELGGSGVVRLLLALLPGFSRLLPLASAPHTLFDMALVAAAMALPRAAAWLALALAERKLVLQAYDSAGRAGGAWGGGAPRMDVRIEAQTFVLHAGGAAAVGGRGAGQREPPDEPPRFEEVESSDSSDLTSFSPGAARGSAGARSPGSPGSPGAGDLGFSSEAEESAEPKSANRHGSGAGAAGPGQVGVGGARARGAKTGRGAAVGGRGGLGCNRKTPTVQRISLKGVSGPGSPGGERGERGERARGKGEEASPGGLSAAGLSDLTRKFLSGYAGVRSGNGRRAPAPRPRPPRTRMLLLSPPLLALPRGLTAAGRQVLAGRTARREDGEPRHRPLHLTRAERGPPVPPMWDFEFIRPTAPPPKLSRRRKRRESKLQRSDLQRKVGRPSCSTGRWRPLHQLLWLHLSGPPTRAPRRHVDLGVLGGRAPPLALGLPRCSSR
jgi:hypothetical protein